jgi:hypothetical protein
MADEGAWLRAFGRDKRRARPEPSSLAGMRRAKAAKKAAVPSPKDAAAAGGAAGVDSTRRRRLRARRGTPVGGAHSPVSAEAAEAEAAVAAAAAATALPIPSSGSMHGMTCARLREVARAHGVPASGTKVRPAPRREYSKRGTASFLHSSHSRSLARPLCRTDECAASPLDQRL